MRTSKGWKFGPGKSMSGFTLIELLIVMVILAILISVVVMAVGGVFSSAKSSAYNTAREQIQAAVTAYSTNASHTRSYPYNTSADYFTNYNCSTCYIINMSMLTVPGEGMLRAVPAGCFDRTSAPLLDNCDGGAAGCNPDSHYVWGADASGSVWSFCDNNSTSTEKCLTNQSGYQGVWP
jgi:prepilin-type N-terminal cleavage/methylation domain-containing protein